MAKSETVVSRVPGLLRLPADGGSRGERYLLRGSDLSHFQSRPMMSDLYVALSHMPPSTLSVSASILRASTAS